MSISSSQSTFRLGVIGAGTIGEQHLRAADMLPQVSVTAVCDVDSARVQTAASRHDAAAFTRWQDLVEQAEVDGVVVALPHSMHAAVTIAAAAAGRHVLVEKPMATSVADCDAMIDACDSAGVRLGVCHVLHYVRHLQAAKEIIDSGELGELLTINLRRSTHYTHSRRPQWFLDKDIAGGGIMINLGAHSIDVAQWLGGSAVTRVAARTMSCDPQLSVETDAIALLELGNGVPVSMTLLGSNMPAQDDIDLVCTGGALTSSHHGGLRLYRQGQGEQVVAPEAGLDEAFGALLADFANAALVGRAPGTDGRWGRDVVAVVEQAYRSQQQHGDWLAVPTAKQAQA